MWDVIAKFWLEWLCGIAAAALAFGFRQLHKRQIRADQRQMAVEKGVQALLRDRILQAYYHYSERGWITLHGLENVESMYREYHNLGGNGTVTKLLKDLRELEVRDS